MRMILGDTNWVDWLQGAAFFLVGVFDRSSLGLG